VNTLVGWLPDGLVIHYREIESKCASRTAFADCDIYCKKSKAIPVTGRRGL
jgi:hypothetical protein